MQLPPARRPYQIGVIFVQIPQKLEPPSGTSKAKVGRDENGNSKGFGFVDFEAPGSTSEGQMDVTQLVSSDMGGPTLKYFQ